MLCTPVLYDAGEGRGCSSARQTTASSSHATSRTHTCWQAAHEAVHQVQWVQAASQGVQHRRKQAVVRQQRQHARVEDGPLWQVGHLGAAGSSVTHQGSAAATQAHMRDTHRAFAAVLGVLCRQHDSRLHNQAAASTASPLCMCTHSNTWPLPGELYAASCLESTECSRQWRHIPQLANHPTHQFAVQHKEGQGGWQHAEEGQEGQHLCAACCDHNGVLQALHMHRETDKTRQR